MEQAVRKTSVISAFVTVLLVMYVLTGILLFVISFLLYKLEIQESTVNVGIIMTYVISGLVGGFFAGKKMKTKKYLWGFLAGVLYFAILLVISLLMKTSILENMEHAVLNIVLCVASSTVGGMLSPGEGGRQHT